MCIDYYYSVVVSCVFPRLNKPKLNTLKKNRLAVVVVVVFLQEFNYFLFMNHFN
jgi:hypothetical protein